MNLMSEIIGHKINEFPVKKDFSRPHPHSSVGIEIEVEGMRVPEKNLKLWNITHDGSLQNGLEFVSHPVWGTAINDALNEIRAIFKKSKPYLSFRTSVHIHVNVLDISIDMLEHMIKLYLFYEPALFRLHKEWSRYDNIFCVPTEKSIAIQLGYAKLIKDIRHHAIRQGYVGYKYSALNPNSLVTFGTLEFRHMGGTDDMDKISDWINILLQLKVAAKGMVRLNDPKMVWEGYKKYLDIRKIDLDKGQEMLDFLNAQIGD